MAARDAAMIACGLPLSRKSPQTVSWFAEQLITSAAFNSITCKAPFVSSGAGLHAMHAALAEVTSTFSPKDVIKLLVQVTNSWEIMHVPWLHDPQPRGRPPVAVTYDRWMNLGKYDDGNNVADDLITPSIC